MGTDREPETAPFDEGTAIAAGGRVAERRKARILGVVSVLIGIAGFATNNARVPVAR